MPKKLRFFIAGLLVLTLLSLVHTLFINHMIDTKMRTLQEQGFVAKLLKDDSTFFQKSQIFLVRLDNASVAAEKLLGLFKKDPFTISLSKFEGTVFRIHLTKSRYIFSSSCTIAVTLDALPDHFFDDATLFNQLQAYFKSHLNIIRIELNPVTGSFLVTVDAIDTQFQADHNISYTLATQPLFIEGNLAQSNDYRARLTLPEGNATLREHNQTKATFTLQTGTLILDRTPHATAYEINLNRFALHINPSMSIALENCRAKHQESLSDFLDIDSSLACDNLHIQAQKHQLTVKEFGYDTRLSHLDREVIDRMKELINVSNTNEQLFIFDDISKELRKLLRMQARLDMRHLRFGSLMLDGVDYENFSLSLHALPKSPVHPFEFDAMIKISQKIYAQFLEHIPNAALTKAFLIDPTQKVLSFHLKTTSQGLQLNNKPLVPHAKKEQ